ncbi:MAG TPA: O-antigen ligase family protein [Patescibacteria group bacterium]|nr:O-antigen ligase family protein [Patescibacteria group bacterium]
MLMVFQNNKIRLTAAGVFLSAALFLLPWQTRWIFTYLPLQGEAWEYGTLSLYGTEILILFALLLRGWPHFSWQARQIVRGSVFFLFAVFLSAIFSIRPILSFGWLLHLVVVFGFLILLLDERTDIRKTATVFILGLIPPSLLGWFQVLSGVSPSSTLFGLAQHLATVAGSSVIENASGRLLRAYGSFSHPNDFGGFLAIGLLVWIFLVGQEESQNWKKWQRMIAFLFAFFLGNALLLTFSRSAWMAFWLGISIWFGLDFFRKVPIPWIRVRVFAAAAFGFLLAALVFSPFVFTRFDTSARLEARSFSERTSEYSTVAEVLRVNPIMGVGIGAYTEALARIWPGQSVWSYQPIHNTFLLILAEIGLMGVVTFFVGVVGIVCRVATADLRPAVAGRFGVYHPFFFALLTAFFVLAFFDHYLWTSWTGMGLVAFVFCIVIRFPSKGDRTNLF